MFFFHKITIAIIFIVLTFVAGLLSGVRLSNTDRPAEVVPTDLMWKLWEVEVKISAQNELIREGIALDSEQGQQFLKEIWGDFEPIVFRHPFVILRRKDGAGYRVFMNADISNPRFDNFTAPTLDFRVSEDHTGVRHYTYLFSMPPRTVAETRTVDFMALVNTDKDGNRVTTVVDISNAEKDERLYWRDSDADGVFETIVHVDSLTVNDAKNKTLYSLIEFAEKFGSTDKNHINADENLVIEQIDLPESH